MLLHHNAGGAGGGGACDGGGGEDAPPKKRAAPEGGRPSRWSLSGKVCVVTGGSKGLGTRRATSVPLSTLHCTPLFTHYPHPRFCAAPLIRTTSANSILRHSHLPITPPFILQASQRNSCSSAPFTPPIHTCNSPGIPGFACAEEFLQLGVECVLLVARGKEDLAQAPGVVQ